MNRKMRRELKRNLNDEMSKNLAEKIFQFNQLPQQCTACDKEFDKTDKEMLQSWKVVVRQEVVRLFCPHCVETVTNKIGEFNERPTPHQDGIK